MESKVTVTDSRLARLINSCDVDINLGSLSESHIASLIELQKAAANLREFAAAEDRRAKAREFTR